MKDELAEWCRFEESIECERAPQYAARFRAVAARIEALAAEVVRLREALENSRLANSEEMVELRERVADIIDPCPSDRETGDSDRQYALRLADEILAAITEGQSDAD